MRLRQFTVGAAMVALLFAGALIAQTKVEKERAEIKARSEASLQTLFTQIPGAKANYDKAVGLRGVRDDQGALHRDGRRRQRHHRRQGDRQDRVHENGHGRRRA